MQEASESDLFFDLLKETSRSFYLGIKSLQEPERDYVCTAYLFCRIIDFFEDSTQAPLETRVKMIEHLNDFLKAIAEPSSPRAPEQVIEQFVSEYKLSEPAFAAYFEKNPHELNLISKAPLILERIKSYPLVIRKVFSDALQDMATGMQSDINRQKHVTEARTLGQLEDYCYTVAGTVGIFLTKVFSLAGALEKQKTAHDLERLGESFGKALQLVNVTKDFHRDWQEMRCFWPGIAAPLKQNSPYPDPSELEASLNLLLEAFDAHRKNAELYIEQICNRRKDVQFFCRFPLEMAKKNMQIATESRDWLKTAKPPKVAKLDTLALLTKLSAQHLA
jgi:farnesyl-diphosphate farnesyltransferase